MSRKRWKKQLFELFAPLWSAPSPPILAQIWIFLAQNLGNYVVVHPLFELGWYLDCGASHSGFSEIGRKPWTGFPSCSVFSARFGWYLGLRLEFFENSFNGRSVGPMPNGEAHLWAYLAPGEVFTRQKPPWNCHFSRYSWFWSAPSLPIPAQNSIFLAQKLLILVRICHGFQSGRMDDSGSFQGCFSEVRPKFQVPNDIFPKFDAFVGPPTVARLTELKNFGTVGSAIGKSPRD